jgi:hypothetical protein
MVAPTLVHEDIGDTAEVGNVVGVGIAKGVDGREVSRMGIYIVMEDAFEVAGGGIGIVAVGVRAIPQF